MARLVTVSIRRLGLGAGFAYLMNSVARGDLDTPAAGSTPLTRSYAESGTPAGRWLGRGLAGLADGAGVDAGSTVSEQGLWRLLGLLSDPVTGGPLGVRPTIVRPPGEVVAGGGGRRAPVAGFDLTISVPKSMSVLWALADPAVQAQVHRAHRDAINHVLAWLEEQVVFTRTGVNGTRQEPVRGLVAAAFDHWDSRAADPHLHTHVVIANRVQTLDGRWRTLDSRTLFRYTVAVSELHEGVLHDLLTDRLGLDWTPRTRTHSPAVRWDVTGIPVQLIDGFSQRSHALGAEKDRLVAEFADAHGRQPSAVEVLKLRQQATLATRPDKQHTTLADLMHTWRTRAHHLLNGDPADVVERVVERALRVRTEPVPHELDDPLVERLAGAALEAVAAKRAVFGEANVLAETHRHLHAHTFPTPAHRLATGQRIAELALTAALPLDPAPSADQVKRQVHRGAARFTTQATLDAETRFIDATTTLTAPTVVAPSEPESGRLLGVDQRAAVETIATSGRVLDVLSGPAGAGKTTTLASLRQVWETAYGPGSVHGLAPSATAAQVLSDELGITAENTAKWLHEHDRNPERQARLDTVLDDLARCRVPGSVRARRLTNQAATIRAEQNRWRLHPGQLVLLDEASLADTPTLDRLTAHAHEQGAKIVLVGDPAQLGSVGAGGMFALLARDHPGAELTDIRRFTHPWEADATRRLRSGDPTAVDTYLEHDRVTTGETDGMADQAVQAWFDDTNNGLDSVLIAADENTVTTLNQLAQAHRADTGTVHPATAIGASGVPLGVGDRIVTRRNDRRLRTHLGAGAWFVKNGDTWTITATHPDGSITVNGADDRVTVLPGDYVRDHVELGYALTAHRTQGHTYDSAHSLIDARSTREVLYVALTRGRCDNRLYLTDADTRDPETDAPDTASLDARQALADLITRTAAQETARETLAQAQATPHAAAVPTLRGGVAAGPLRRIQSSVLDL